MREAIAFARKTSDGVLLLRLATALWGFWSIRVYGAEGRRALEEALELSGRRSARTLLGLCTLRCSAGVANSCGEFAEEALAACAGASWATTTALRRPGTSSAGRGPSRALWGPPRKRGGGASFARRGGYRAELAESISWSVEASAVFGPLPVEEGIERCREFLALDGDDPTIRATCSVERAVLEAMRGDIDTARELLAEGRRTIEESGLTLWAALNAQETYLVEHLAGTPGAASETLRDSFTTLDEGGERAYLSTSRASSPMRSSPKGRLDEAERFSRECQQAAGPDDVLSQVLWRTARAKILARRGTLEPAEALAREAVGRVEPTDLLGTRADALVELTEVLALAGRRETRWPLSARPAELYERKGNRTALARAQARARERGRFDTAGPSDDVAP